MPLDLKCSGVYADSLLMTSGNWQCLYVGKGGLERYKQEPRHQDYDEFRQRAERMGYKIERKLLLPFAFSHRDALQYESTYERLLKPAFNRAATLSPEKYAKLNALEPIELMELLEEAAAGERCATPWEPARQIAEHVPLGSEILLASDRFARKYRELIALGHPARKITLVLDQDDEVQMATVRHAKGVRILNVDFLQHDFEGKSFDFVIGNPPWNRYVWLRFLKKAQTLLGATGQIIFIVPQFYAKNFKEVLVPKIEFKNASLIGSVVLTDKQPLTRIMELSNRKVVSKYWAITFAFYQRNIHEITKTPDAPLLAIATDRKLTPEGQPLFGKVTTARELYAETSNNTRFRLIYGERPVLERLAERLTDRYDYCAKFIIKTQRSEQYLSGSVGSLTPATMVQMLDNLV